MTTFLAILTHTPIWVWAVFALIIFLGYQRTRDRTIQLWRLLLLPVIMILLAAVRIGRALDRRIRVGHHAVRGVVAVVGGVTVRARALKKRLSQAPRALEMQHGSKAFRVGTSRLTRSLSAKMPQATQKIIAAEDEDAA